MKRILRSKARCKPGIFLFNGKWICSMFDYVDGVGDTPAAAYEDYMKKIRGGDPYLPRKVG